MAEAPSQDIPEVRVLLVRQVLEGQFCALCLVLGRRRLLFVRRGQDDIEGGRRRNAYDVAVLVSDNGSRAVDR